MNSIIAAAATAAAPSAIGIVRISGESSLSVLSQVFTPRNSTVSEMRSAVLTRGIVTGAGGGIIDDCCAIVFHAPRSYTGEDSAEIHCHGSPAVLRETLKSLIAAGARLARPGEFTYRAFLAGKLDLIEAEAVADLIDAESPAAVYNAAGHLTGQVSRKLTDIYERLIGIKAHFHAAVDYYDEDIDEFDTALYAGIIGGAADELRAMADTHERSDILKNGILCAIIGKPNAGKSSLFNTILGSDRAIVTALPGTTRDTIEERISIGNNVLRLIDTAGLREADDEAEKLGVERSEQTAAAAAIVLAVFDGAGGFTPEDEQTIITAKGGGSSPIAVINKTDIADSRSIEKTHETLSGYFTNIVSASAATGSGISELLRTIVTLLPEGDAAIGEIITSSRQYEALVSARRHAIECREALLSGVTPDAALSELELSLNALGDALGKNVREDTLEHIFSRFCVGK